VLFNKEVDTTVSQTTLDLDNIILMLDKVLHVLV